MAKSKRIRDLNRNQKARYRLDCQMGLRKRKIYLNEASDRIIIGATYPSRDLKNKKSPYALALPEVLLINEDGGVSDQYGANLDEMLDIAESLIDSDKKHQFFFLSKAEDNIVEKFRDFKAFKEYLTPQNLGVEEKDKKLVL